MPSSIMRMKTTAAAAIFSTFICLLSFPSTVLSVIFFNKIQLPPNATGPEALAFEFVTGKFYTGIADGRILKYQGPTTGFVDFGFAAPNRSKSVCDGTANPNPVCGTQLSTAADGEPYRFCDGPSTNWKCLFHRCQCCLRYKSCRQLEIAVSVNDSTGRLLKYDFENKQVTVLFKNLSGVGGVAVDEEEKFVLVSEFIMNRTVKIWLQGPKANKSEIIKLQPTPDNIKRTTARNFWLAAAMVNRRTQSLVPIGQRIDPFAGSVSQTVNFERCMVWK